MGTDKSVGSRAGEITGGTGAGCHPQSPRFAFGLCEECYKAVWYYHRNLDIEIRRRILFPAPEGAPPPVCTDRQGEDRGQEG